MMIIRVRIDHSSRSTANGWEDFPPQRAGAIGRALEAECEDVVACGNRDQLFAIT